MTTTLTETIAVPTRELDLPLLPGLAWLASVKTVVEGGGLGCNGGLPAAVFVEPVSVLFGFVFSVCCGRFGNCCFPYHRYSDLLEGIEFLRNLVGRLADLLGDYVGTRGGQC